MEAIINHVEGDQLEPKACVFCDKEKDISCFGVLPKEGIKWNGRLMTFFGVCEEHLDRINALLSGEYDIDTILLEKYRKPLGKNVRLRG